MSNFIDTIKDAIGSMRYGSTGEVIWFWVLMVILVLIALAIVAIIGGTIYCKLNGISVPLPFLG